MLLFLLLGRLNVSGIFMPSAILLIIDYFERFWVTLGSFPLVIKIAVSVIIFSTLATIVCVIIIFIIRNAKEKRGNIALELRPKMFTFFRNIMISGESFTPVVVREAFEMNFGSLNNRAYISIIPALEDVTDQKTDTYSKNNYNSIIKGLEVDTYFGKKA